MGKSVAGCAGALAVFILASVSISPVRAGPAGPALADGVWGGTLFAHQAVDFSGTATQFVWTGELEFTSAEGELLGSLVFEGGGTVAGELASGTSNASGGGVITGPAFQPHFQVTDAIFNTTVVVPGLDPIDISFPITAADTAVIPITLTSVTCQQAVGDWDQVVLDFYSGMDAQVNTLTTAFNMARLGPADLNDEVASLYEEIQAFEETMAQTGKVDAALLEGLLAHAFDLTAAIKKDSGCPGSDSKVFLTPVTQAILNLVEFALDPANSAFFSTEDLATLISNAIATGALGSGAPNQAKSQELINQYSDLLDARLQSATTNGPPASEGDCKEMKAVMLGAYTVSAGTLADLAEDFYSSYGCGG